MAKRPHDPDPASGYASRNGWDHDYETYSDFDLPTYVGPVSFSKLPWVDDPAELCRLGVDVAIVGAPFDDASATGPAPGSGRGRSARPTTPRGASTPCSSTSTRSRC